MKVVIDIPDQKYKWIMENPDIYSDLLERAVRKGMMYSENTSVWHPVKECLPDKEGTYLVCTKNKAVIMTHFYMNSRRFSSIRINKQIIAWMALPAPYVESGDDNDKI